MANTLKTLFFLALMSGIFLLIGRAVGGAQGMTFALIFAGVMNFGTWFFADRIVLFMHGAKVVTAQEAPELHQIVAECAANAKLPMPRVAIVDGAPNAFATGRNPQHGVVAVSRSLLGLLNREELKGVVAHELGHIRNRDTLIMAVAATMAATIMYVANIIKWGAIFGGGSRDDDDNYSGIAAIALAILAPIAAVLIQAAISRSREFEADATGAAIAGNSGGLASALAKLHGASQVDYAGPHHAPQPATAHMMIVNPLSARGVFNLFSTHPPAAERIARLRQLRTA